MTRPAASRWAPTSYSVLMPRAFVMDRRPMPSGRARGFSQRHDPVTGRAGLRGRLTLTGRAVEDETANMGLTLLYRVGSKEPGGVNGTTWLRVSSDIRF